MTRIPAQERIVVFGDGSVLAPRCQRGWAELIWTPARSIHVEAIPRGRLVDACRAAPRVVETHAPWSAVVVAFGRKDARGGSCPPREAEALLRQLLTVLATGGPVFAIAPIPPLPGCAVRGFGRDARRWIEKNGVLWDNAAGFVRSVTGERVSILRPEIPVESMVDDLHLGPAGHAVLASEIDKALVALYPF